jgi:phage tail-like protein
MADTYNFQLTITGPDKAERVALAAGVTVLGRQPGVDILLEHPLVSRRHAQLIVTATTCELTDLGSSNGTRLNGRALPANSPTFLNPNDVVEMGPFKLELELELEPEREEEEEKDAAIPITPPTPPPPPPISPSPRLPISPSPQPLPGLATHSTRLLAYLPGIYHTDLMSRFLALFESILIPIEWNIDNFDLYLDPQTSPVGFLPWLCNWFEMVFDDTWNERQQRQFLGEAAELYGRRGTQWAMSRLLEIYTGHAPQIDDKAANLDPFTFIVNIPVREKELNRTLIEHIIDGNKPAHTTYKLRFKQ